LVKRALVDSRTYDINYLVGTEPKDWQAALRNSPEQAALLYAQSWSIVYFLIHGENERYQSAFARYLKRVGEGRESRAAFEEAFGTSELRAMETRWERHAFKQNPDPINTAASRMEFLGEALRYIHQNDEKMPRSIGKLRDLLQSRRFVLTHETHGVKIEMDSRDDELYRFKKHNGSIGRFRLLDPARNDLPPRITAEGLRPEPTLVWSRDDDGNLVQDIEYR